MLRIPVSGRESASYVLLRRKDYSINAIAKAFGRSSSVIHKRIERAVEFGILKLGDKRKIPNAIRRARAVFEWRRMLKYLPRWQEWILSDEGEPP